MPLATHKARAPAILRPWVQAILLNGYFTGQFLNSLKKTMERKISPT